jgi:hypothetical protein
MSTKRIRKINAVQAGKVSAILSVALILIIFVPLILFVSMLGLGRDSGLSAGIFLGGGLLALIFIPIIYGGVAFVLGVLYAVIYNYTYKWHGGVELEYDDMEDVVGSIGQ